MVDDQVQPADGVGKVWMAKDASGSVFGSWHSLGTISWPSRTSVSSSRLSTRTHRPDRSTRPPWPRRRRPGCSPDRRQARPWRTLPASGSGAGAIDRSQFDFKGWPGSVHLLAGSRLVQSREPREGRPAGLPGSPLHRCSLSFRSPRATIGLLSKAQEVDPIPRVLEGCNDPFEEAVSAGFIVDWCSD